MAVTLKVVLNGESRELPELESGVPLARLLESLSLRADRIAVELNGELAPRTGWSELAVHSGDRLEVVHFVGGGRSSAA